MKLRPEGSREVQEGLGSVRCLDPLSFGSGEVKNISIFLKQRQGGKKLGIPVLGNSVLQKVIQFSRSDVFFLFFSWLL